MKATSTEQRFQLVSSFRSRGISPKPSGNSSIMRGCIELSKAVRGLIKTARVKIDEQELRRLYEQERLSPWKIARIMACSKSLIADRMRKCISPRSPRASRKFDIPKAELWRLYHQGKQSQDQIAALYGCSQSLIWLKMREDGIPSRSHADASILARGYAYQRRDLKGDAVKRAYYHYLGFSRGDVHIRRLSEGGQTLEASCGSSKQAQIELFRSLFAPYGHIWQRKPDTRGRIWITAYMKKALANIETRNQKLSTRGKKDSPR